MGAELVEAAKSADTNAELLWCPKCMRLCAWLPPVLLLWSSAAASAVDSWVSEQLEAVQSADKNTERALMGFESVSLPRPPTFSTFQTLDMLSRIAQGATLLALHSQQGPAPSCAGLDLALGTLEAHPKVALVGFRAEPVEHGLAKAEEALKNSKAFKPIAGPKGSPPGLGFSFANYVSGLPLVVRSSALRTIGGIDDTPLLGPDGQIIDAWMLSTRLWLAGFQVSHLLGVRGSRASSLSLRNPESWILADPLAAFQGQRCLVHRAPLLVGSPSSLWTPFLSPFRPCQSASPGTLRGVAPRVWSASAGSHPGLPACPILTSKSTLQISLSPHVPYPSGACSAPAGGPGPRGRGPGPSSGQEDGARGGSRVPRDPGSLCAPAGQAQGAAAALRPSGEGAGLRLMTAAAQ